MSLDAFFQELSIGRVPSEKQSMKFEGLRLATYHCRPRSHKTSASRLAHAGFYYTGEADIVACFRCGLRVGKWESLGLNADPIAIHSERSPNCAFLVNDKENVPYTVQDSQLSCEAKKFKDGLRANFPSRGVKLKALLGSKPQERSFQEEVTLRRSQPISKHREADVVEINTSDLNPNKCPFSGVSYSANSTGLFNRSNTSNNAQLVPTPRSLADNPPPSVHDNELQGKPNFKDEQVRLDSFTFWSNGSAARPAELAKAGFYFLGTEDRVQCAFCKGVLRNWDPTDVVLEEHKRHFPACPFMKDPKSVGNIPRLGELSGVKLKKEVPESQELGEYLMGIMTQKAYHPEMAVKVDRMNSYVNFRSDSRRTPEEFADAGFYFTGQGDNIKCFFCDGGLRNWERNDDPWLEHARWFPKCDYLRSKKGDAYIKDIRKKYAPPGSNKPRIKKLKSRYDVSTQQIDDVMNSELVNDAVNMGFTLSQIKTSVGKRLSQLGSNFPNVESLVDSLYEEEELAQQGSDSESDMEASSGEQRNSTDSQEERLEASALETDGPNNDSNSGAKSAKTEKKRNKRRRKSKKKQEAAQINPVALMSEGKNTELVKEVQKMKDERLCKVCLDNEVNIVFLKCGHLVCCGDCAPSLRNCPICRENIRGTIRVFIS